MGEGAIAKEPRKHSECACRQYLIDEWLLPFERFRRAATRQRVFACFRIRNLWIEFHNGSQPGRAATVRGVQRLAEHVLATARIIAEVEPVDGAVIRSGDRGQDGLPRRPCVDTANNQVGTCRIASQRILVKVLGVRLPPQTPEEIDAVDQNNCLVQSDIGRGKRLADTVGFSSLIPVHQRHVEPCGVAPHFHRLVEIGQAEQHGAAIASRADDQNADWLTSPAE